MCTAETRSAHPPSPLRLREPPHLALLTCPLLTWHSSPAPSLTWHSLDGVKPLQLLKKLDASHNHLSELGALLSLVSLTQLSLESNAISSFTGLTELVHL